MNYNDVAFKSTITIAEKARAITMIVESLFNDGEYLPEVFDEQFWLHIATTYLADDIADIDGTSDEFMDALYNDNLMDKMTSTINPNQLDSIKTAVLKRIEMRLDKKPIDEFFERATNLLVKIESAVDGVDLKGAIDGFSKLDISADLAKALAKSHSPKGRNKNMKED